MAKAVDFSNPPSSIQSISSRVSSDNIENKGSLDERDISPLKELKDVLPFSLEEKVNSFRYGIQLKESRTFKPKEQTQIVDLLTIPEREIAHPIDYHTYVTHEAESDSMEEENNIILESHAHIEETEQKKSVIK